MNQHVRNAHAVDNFMRLHGARMSDAGFHIVPLVAGKKYPGSYAYGRWTAHENWQFFAYTKAPESLIETWSSWPGCGIGIACGGNSA